MSVVGGDSSTSSQQLDDLSSQLQQVCARQTGTLIMDHHGVVAAASGDMKEAADRIAQCLLTLLQDTNGVFVHSAARPADEQKEELVKITSQTSNEHTDRDFAWVDAVCR